MPFSRVPGVPPANPSNEPPLIFSAAPIAAAHATRASAPPMLIRLTPRSASSATVRPGALITTLSGFGETARTSAAITPEVDKELIEPLVYRPVPDEQTED